MLSLLEAEMLRLKREDEGEYLVPSTGLTGFWYSGSGEI